MAAAGFLLFMESWGTTLAIISAGAAYGVYYLKRVVHRPVIACGNTKLEQFLHRHVPSVQEIYWPTFWCFQGHAHTVLAVLFRMFIDRSYRREILEMPDGGVVFLDWTDADDTSSLPPDQRPTVVIMPGLTGSSNESYIKHFADDMHQIGFRSVVFNQRGYAGSTLKTPRGFCAGNTEDLHTVVTHIKSSYPDAPIAVLGLSIGGIILLNYLAEHGDRAQIVGALPVSALWDLLESNISMERQINWMLFNSYLTRHLKGYLRRIILLNYLAEYGDRAPIVGALPVSAAWDLHKSNIALEKNLNWLLFNMYLTNNLKNYLKSNKGIIEDKYDIEHILQSKTIYEFDNRMTAGMFGYRDADHYYDEASPHGKLDRIKIPTLCLNAADDPFAPLHTLPLQSAMESSHTAIVVPKYGGHLGFMHGMIPIGKTLMSRVFKEFMTAIFHHGEDLAI